MGMKLWVTDPTTGQKSVSLTMLLVAVICAVTAGGLQMFGLVETTSLFSEFMYSCVALYFGRRFQVNGKSFNSEKAEAVKEKLE